MKKNILIGQSGGPTVAINATTHTLLDRSFPTVDHADPDGNIAAALRTALGGFSAGAGNMGMAVPG